MTTSGATESNSDDKDESLPPGWAAVIGSSRRRLLGELRREVVPAHPLFGVPAEGIARRIDRDDVLFRCEDGTGRVASIHLTWSGRPEISFAWPSALIFDGLASWRDHVLSEADPPTEPLG